MRNITLAVVVMSWSEENTGVEDLNEVSSANAPDVPNTGVGGGIPNSDRETAFTPIILWFRGVRAFSAFFFALRTAFPKRSSFTSSCYCGDRVKDTLSTLFAPDETAPSIMSAAFPSWLVSTEIVFVTRYPISSWVYFSVTGSR